MCPSLIGTPAGVGPVKSGEKIHGGLKTSADSKENVVEFQFGVVDRKGKGHFSS